MNNEDKIWNFLMGEISNPYGVAGLMGNLKAESAFNPQNLQNSYEKKLGFSDDTYTVAVDTGVYSKERFCKDCAGYGLAQWTYWTRKQGLYEYAKRAGSSVGDLFLQLSYLIDELRAYKLLDPLRTAQSVKEASDIILTRYEKPADQSESAKNRRAGYGLEIYEAHSKELKSVDVLEELTKIQKLVDNISNAIVELKKKFLKEEFTWQSLN